MPFADPEAKRRWTRENRRKRRAEAQKAALTSAKKRGPQKPLSDPILKTAPKNAKDLKAALGKLIFEVSRHGSDLLLRARVLSALSGVFLQADERSDLEGRLEAVEKSLKKAQAAFRQHRQRGAGDD